MPHETSHQNKNRNQDSPSHVSRIWQETQSRFEELLHTGEPAVLKAAPGSGKTTASFRVARENQQQLTYLAARHDMYTEAKEKALEAGFDSQDIAIIPSPHTDCPTFRGDHGSEKREEWRKLYQLGINAGALHYRFTAPCEPGCPYLEKRIDDPDDYDVIIGHYVHGRDTEKIADRLTVVDEFPGSAFTTSFSTRPSDTMAISEAVNGYFAVTDYIPWDNYGDFVANINKEPAWKISGNIQYHGFRAAESDIVELNPDKRYHRLAPLIIFALHNAANVDGGWTDWDALDDLCNDWHYFNTDEFFAAYPPKERMRWGVPGRAIIIRKEGDSLEQEELHVLQPVDLSPAEQVIGLDGTARKRLWDTIFTQEFRVKEYIANERMAEYVTECSFNH